MWRNLVFQGKSSAVSKSQKLEDPDKAEKVGPRSLSMCHDDFNLPFIGVRREGQTWRKGGPSRNVGWRESGQEIAESRCLNDCDFVVLLTTEYCSRINPPVTCASTLFNFRLNNNDRKARKLSRPVLQKRNNYCRTGADQLSSSKQDEI